LQEGIPVGNFWLEEAVSRRQILTGESFTYQFDVWGEGNLSTVSVAARTGNAFDFYPPEIKVNVNTVNNRPSGRKTFRFTAVPREPGRYPLDTVFRLIYFNPNRRRYDTLHSRTVLEVTGQSLRNVRMQASEIEPVYREIGSESNQLRPLHQGYPFRQAANVLLVLMMLITLVLMGYKK
jgi:hypothetical protein